MKIFSSFAKTSTSNQVDVTQKTDGQLLRAAQIRVAGLRGAPGLLQRTTIAEMQQLNLFPSCVKSEHLADFYKLDALLSEAAR